MNAKGKLKVILILSDGIRGHINQSRGVAYWLAKMTGAEIEECEVPELKGALKARSRSASKCLIGGTRREARDWLSAFNGDEIVREVGIKLGRKNVRENGGDLLIISAGSTAAPYNLALAYIWSCACAVIMTPSVIGTEPFDFAIVPEHDFPERKQNIFVTLGSPNYVVKEDLKKQASDLLLQFPPDKDAGELWSILIGGDDANYKITPQWVKNKIGRILTIAKHVPANVYITTSRRTNAETEKAIKLLAAHSPEVKYLCIASKDNFNPIPAMLGFSDEVFCTEDSVNMVSETITGGCRAVLLRVDRKRGIRNILQRLTAILVNIGAIPQNFLWGISKFDLVFNHFARSNNLVEFKEWQKRRIDSEDKKYIENKTDFNEARRAAEWICENWR